MSNKDTINKVSGVVAIGTLCIIITGIITENESLLGFPNAMALYLLLPSSLIWFGTRKNGCGSCSQSCSATKQEKNTN